MMKRILLTLGILCLPAFGFTADFQTLTLSRTFTAADNSAHAQHLLLDTTESFYLWTDFPRVTRFWVGFFVDNDTTMPSGAQGDSLTIIIQHSPNGSDNWTFLDSTGKATLAGDALINPVTTSIKSDSVFVMPYIRLIASYSDSVISLAGNDGNTYKTRIRFYLYPSN